MTTTQHTSIQSISEIPTGTPNFTTKTCYSFSMSLSILSSTKQRSTATLQKLIVGKPEHLLDVANERWHQPSSVPKSLGDREYRNYTWADSSIAIGLKTIPERENGEYGFITKDVEPDCIPLSTNVNLKCNKRMLYFPIDFWELNIDGLIDTGALSSAIPEMDLRKNRILSTLSYPRRSLTGRSNYGR